MSLRRQLSTWRQPVTAAWAGAAVLAAVSSVGCFDAQALAAARNKAVEGSKLDHIDLGAFHVTMPRMPGEAEMGEIDLHPFARVERRRLEEVEAALADHGPEIRADILTSIRGLSRQEVLDPKLTELKRRLAAAVNHAVGAEHVQSIGFFDFSVRSE